MKTVYPQLFNDFACLKGACPDSCCTGWEVDVDDETLAYYKGISGNIKKRIDSVLTFDEYQNHIFRLTEKKRCPFLNSADLCDIHIELGVQHTPLTCRNFPKFINPFGALTEIGYSFSCPVAAGLMWQDENALNFCEKLTDEPPHFNDIDASLFYELKSARQHAFDIAADPTATTKQKAAQLLQFGKEVQKEIKKPSPAAEKLSFFDVFKYPEFIHNEWLKKLENPNCAPVSLPATAAKNILIYFIYRYFLNAVYDREALPRLSLAVLGLLVPACFGNDSRTMQMWSKETEHSDVNMSRLKHCLASADCLSESALIEKADEMLL